MNRIRITPTTTALAALVACALAAFPSIATASSSEDRSLQETVRDADLIIVGTVTAIDSEAGVKDDDPMTRIDVLVERTLRGETAKRGETFSLYHRGGMHSDGSTTVWTNVDPLAVGDTYVMFLGARFTVTPFMGTLWRVVNAGAKKVIVDRGGRPLGYSETHGLLRGSKLTDSLVERVREKAEGALVSNHDMSARVAVEDVGEMEAHAADAEVVFAGIAAMVRSSMPVITEMASGTRPLPIPAVQTDRRKEAAR